MQRTNNPKLVLNLNEYRRDTTVSRVRSCFWENEKSKNMIWPLGIWCLGKDVVATQLQDEEESGFFSQEMCFTFRHWNVTFMVVLLKVAEIFTRYTFPFFSSCLRMTVIYTHTTAVCFTRKRQTFPKVGGWGQEAIREEETMSWRYLPLDSFHLIKIKWINQYGN